MTRKPLLLALAAIAVALAVAAPVAARMSATSSTTVRVTATEMKFALSKRTVPKGTVVFNVVNRGKLPHDFKIAGKKSPVLRAGKSGKLTARFAKAGRYPYLCTIPGHAAAGMKGVLVVR
jgi:uncharacterized cupredoxin-like copper-binding protein